MPQISSQEIMFRAFEPKVQNRFIMYLEDVPTYMVKGVGAINFQDGEIKLDHINSYRKIRGGQRVWQDVSMTLYDPISPSGAAMVMDWARQSFESITGRAQYSDIYKKEMRLNLLGPIGDIVGEWVLQGAFIKSSNFGALNWSTFEALNVEVTVAYDMAILNY